MKPWIGEYPAKFIAVIDFNEILFDIALGFGLTIRQSITLDLDDVVYSKKNFLKKKLEAMLHSASSIFLRFCWEAGDDHKPSVDVEVDHVDLMEHLENQGYFS